MGRSQISSRLLDRQAINQLTNLVDALKNNPEIKIAISLPPATLSGISQSNNQKDELLLLELKRLAKTQIRSKLNAVN